MSDWPAWIIAEYYEDDCCKEFAKFPVVKFDEEIQFRWQIYGKYTSFDCPYCNKKLEKLERMTFGRWDMNCDYKPTWVLNTGNKEEVPLSEIRDVTKSAVKYKAEELKEQLKFYTNVLNEMEAFLIE